MALSKKPVNGMKDILPAEMEIRDYVTRNLSKLWFYTNRNPLHGKYCKPFKQAGWRKRKTYF